jgi:hypothetical protein
VRARVGPAYLARTCGPTTLYRMLCAKLRPSRDSSAIMRRRSSDSHVKRPCFRAFRLPLGAPPPAPCIRQTLQPCTAGDWQGFPLRFDLAEHLLACCM